MKRLFTSFQYLCICFLCAITQNVFAQGWKIVNESGDDIDMSTVRLTDYNDAYRLTANGDYYIVAPQGKHITSAKLTFLYLYDIAKTKSNSFSSDKKYVLSWKYGNRVNYIQQFNGNINQYIYVHVEDGHAIWNIIPATGGGYYFKNNNTNNYIYITGSGSSGTKLTSSSTQPSKTWSYTENNGFYTTNGDVETRYLCYNKNSIYLSSSSSTNTKIYAYELSPDYPLEKGTYTATVYDTDGISAGNYTLNGTTAISKELTGLNSDCVKFNISDLAENKFASIRVEVTLADGEVGGNPEAVVSTPMYTSTLRPGVNNDNVDTESQFVGIKVTPTKVTHSGSDVLSAIESKWNTLNTVLYVDMSEMNIISDADALLDDLKADAAPNCLFFMPSSYKGSHANTIVGGANGTAAGDITVVDQQPFFTPYVFSTGGKMAIYQRTGANGHVASQNTTLILPFDVPVANKRDLKFYTLSEIGEEDEEAKVNTVAYLFTATEVTGDAVANTPYQVKKEGDGHYTIQANNTTFRPTPEGGLVTAQNGSLTAYGNYTGVAVPKGEGILYFSQNYFWNSTTLTTSATHIKILPYRVYYKTSSQTNDPKYSVLFLTDDPEDELSEDFGNQDITAIKAMQTEDAKTVWYNMNGQKLNGRPTLPGVYVMNGKKVLIK